MTIRYLITTICIVLFLWGCDSATEPPAKPKVVRKKIVAEKKQTAKVRKKKTVRTAKVPKAATEEKTSPARVETQPLAAKKPAIKPKSDISTIKQPVAAKKSKSDRKLVASASVGSQGLTGIPGMYDPTGKVDPFEPLFTDKPASISKKRLKKRIPQTPLERIDLSQLKLVGIILAASGNRALVEEASGKGYVVKKGTYIGINGGKIIKIKKETVIIEEEYEDIFGKITTRQRKVKLPKPPGEF